MRSSTWLSLAMVALIACTTVQAHDFVVGPDAEHSAPAEMDDDLLDVEPPTELEDAAAAPLNDDEVDAALTQDVQMDDDFHQNFVKNMAASSQSTEDVETEKEELQCGRLQIRKNGKCVDLQTCPKNQYRIGKVCKTLPKTKTCEAEYNAIVERKRKEDPLREKEMAVIATIREIIARMNGVEDVDESTGLSVKKLLPLLETATDDERKHAEVTGEGGVVELVDKLEAHLIADAKLAEKEVKDLFNHCVEMCKIEIAMRKKTVAKWKEEKRLHEIVIENKRKEIEKEEGILAAMQKKYEYNWDVYLKTRSLRGKENSLIGWLKNKVAAVRGVKEEKPAAEQTELAQEDIEDMVDGLDTSNANMARVVALLQRGHAGLDEVGNLLDEILQENEQAEKDDQERLRLERVAIAKQKAKIAALEKQLEVLLEQLENIKRLLKEAEDLLDIAMRECANFGASPLD